jgi:hypothetical protein
MAYKGPRAKDILRDAAIKARAEEAKRKREEEEKKAAEDTSESRVERIFRIVRSKLSETAQRDRSNDPRKPWDKQHDEALEKAKKQPTFTWTRGKGKKPSTVDDSWYKNPEKVTPKPGASK